MIGNRELQERMAEQMEFTLSQTPEALATENAKLRKEVDKLRKVIESEIRCWQTGGCAGCPAYRPDVDGWCDQGVWLEELGFEVDE